MHGFARLRDAARLDEGAVLRQQSGGILRHAAGIGVHQGIGAGAGVPLGKEYVEDEFLAGVRVVVRLLSECASHFRGEALQGGGICLAGRGSG